MPQKVIFNIGDERADLLRNVADAAQVTMTDLLKRCLDHCFQERVLNEMLPRASGQLLRGDGRC